MSSNMMVASIGPRVLLGVVALVSGPSPQCQIITPCLKNVGRARVLSLLRPCRGLHAETPHRSLPLCRAGGRHAICKLCGTTCGAVVRIYHRGAMLRVTLRGARPCKAWRK